MDVLLRNMKDVLWPTGFIVATAILGLITNFVSERYPDSRAKMRAEVTKNEPPPQA